MSYTIDNFTPRDVMILQQVHEDGEDDVALLSREIGESPATILARLKRLHKKGLIKITSTYEDIWVRLTEKGKRAIDYIWLDARA